MGLFERLRLRRSGPPGTPRRANLAMILLRAARPVPWEAVAAHLRATFPDFPAHGSLEVSENAASLPVSGGAISLGYMPAPVPWSDLDWPVRAAWDWPDARATLEGHAAHVIVFASAETGSPVQLAWMLTRVVASAAAATDALGVYYGNAALVVPAARYLADARAATPAVLPLSLWLGFHPVPDERGLSAYTTGMPAFDLLDLEAHDTPLDTTSLLGRLADVANYELVRGVQIRDGETVGATAEERIPVRHRPSRFGNHAVTCQLLLHGAA